MMKLSEFYTSSFFDFTEWCSKTTMIANGERMKDTYMLIVFGGVGFTLWSRFLLGTPDASNVNGGCLHPVTSVLPRSE